MRRIGLIVLILSAIVALASFTLDSADPVAQKQSLEWSSDTHGDAEGCPMNYL